MLRGAHWQWYRKCYCSCAQQCRSYGCTIPGQTPSLCNQQRGVRRLLLRLLVVVVLLLLVLLSPSLSAAPWQTLVGVVVGESSLPCSAGVSHAQRGLRRQPASTCSSKRGAPQQNHPHQMACTLLLAHLQAPDPKYTVGCGALVAAIYGPV